MIAASILKVKNVLKRLNSEHNRSINAHMVCFGTLVKIVYLVCLGLFDVFMSLFRVYPFVNELMGLISVICHSKKIIF